MKDSLFNRHLHSCRQSSSTPRPRNATNNKSADYPLTSKEGSDVKGWAKAQGYERYLGSSIKGESAIDWSDKRARAGLLATIVADADRLLELSRQAQEALPEGSPERQGIVAAAELLGQLLLQSLPPTPIGGRGAHRRGYWPQGRGEQGPGDVGA